MNTNRGDSTAHALTFDCEQSVRRLWDYLDGELDPIELSAVDAHLAECDMCPQHFVFEQRFLDVVRTARGDAAAADSQSKSTLRDRVMTMLMAAGEIVNPGSVV